jgi:putative MATE family efflux protein
MMRIRSCVTFALASLCLVNHDSSRAATAFAPSLTSQKIVLPRSSIERHRSRTFLPAADNKVRINWDDKEVVNGSKSSSETDDGETQQKDIFLKNERNTKRKRFLKALPRVFSSDKDKGDDLDDLILRTAIPSMINLGVVPIVNSVDCFWVGRLGSALALAGQSAANQASFTVFFLIAFLPNITAPLVAKAVASNNTEEAQKRVCESIFLCTILGIFGSGLLIAFPRKVLGSLVMAPNSPAMDYAAPYLRWRALGMVPSLISATGFAAYRGMLNTVTPLKVSLMTNALNLVLDPLLIFRGGMGFVGAAVATAAAEMLGGATYLRLLMRRKLARWSMLLKPPSMKSIVPLLQGGAAMLFRQISLNVGFLFATRRAQLMDPSGVSGAAYGITMQIYSVGIIMLIAMQITAAALIPTKQAQGGEVAARETADRLFAWSTLAGCSLGLLQYLLLPVLVPIFSTLPAVQEAARLPILVASLIHVVNGPILVGEGVMMGTGSYKDLAIVTAIGTAGMVASLMSPLGKRLDGIMWSILISSTIQQLGVVTHYLKFSPLAVKKKRKTA